MKLLLKLNRTAMKDGMKILIVFSWIILISPWSLSAQINAVTEDGKQVILEEDGTWAFQEETGLKKDTLNLECSYLVKTETDRVTGKTRTSSEALLISDNGETGLVFMGYKMTSVVTSVTILAIGASSCVDDTDKVYILFRDGTRLEIENDFKYNCDKTHILLFGGSWGKKKQFQMLLTKEIEIIRAETVNGFVERELTSDQSQIILSTLNCIYG